VSNTPSFPKKLPTVLIATLAALLLSSGFVITSELLSGPGRQPVFIHSTPLLAEIRTDPESRDAEPAASRIDEVPSHDEAGTFAAEVAGTVSPPPRDVARELADGIVAAGEAGRRIAVIGVGGNIGTTSTAVALGRALTTEGKVVLVDLALATPNISAISRDPAAPGVADLIRGSASFRHVITRDRFSRVHLVSAGRLGSDSGAILSSDRLTIGVNALARTYDHVVIDAGAISDTPLARIAELAPQAVLVATGMPAERTDAARDQLMQAGFTNVTVFTDKAPRPDEAPQQPAAA
jgi:Mrp family chromosome partitioning ATPase